MAELGFVGSAPEKYQIWLGGTPNQTQLAQPYIDKLPIAELESFLEPIFVFFRDNHQPEESFGEFCQRVGFTAIREFAEQYQKSPTTKSRRRNRKNQHRIGIADELFVRLKQVSVEQKRPMNQIVSEALEAYFNHQE
jgi:sulfite reductase (ferredoxin)